MTPWAARSPAASLEIEGMRFTPSRTDQEGRTHHDSDRPDHLAAGGPRAEKARMWAEDRLVLLKAATERRHAFIVALLFVNPTVDVASGFAVPPTTQLASRTSGSSSRS